jgi:hypothetical protein
MFYSIGQKLRSLSLRIISVVEIPSGRGEAIGGHFSPRSTIFVHFFGWKSQKIGRVFWEEVILGPVWLVLCGFCAKNQPV